MLSALIFDVDGTLADTETAHCAAFNAAFAQMGLDWHWDRDTYQRLLAVSGGVERMAQFWRETDPEAASSPGAEATLRALHQAKTRFYTGSTSGSAASGPLALRPGVLRLMREARASGLRLAIATTTTPANIAALLQPHLGAQWERWFDAIGDGHSAPVKKPHPQVYTQVLSRLGLDARSVIAFEDSANGLRAATAAGLATVVTPTAWTRHDGFAGALAVLPSLGEPDVSSPELCVDVARLRRWHASFWRDSAAPARRRAPLIQSQLEPELL
ncbi:HAD-IA family hydrolase [Amphibiibacter pelophylacis]|uniref:HAD-IA family hydrolase n=1 Tax=Amphibiibacter pelophylacis TaxID=1799477 RepID=A0ACC6P5N5_9BURK